MGLHAGPHRLQRLAQLERFCSDQGEGGQSEGDGPEEQVQEEVILVVFHMKSGPHSRQYIISIISRTPFFQYIILPLPEHLSGHQIAFHDIHDPCLGFTIGSTAPFTHPSFITSTLIPFLVRFPFSGLACVRRTKGGHFIFCLALHGTRR